MYIVFYTVAAVYMYIYACVGVYIKTKLHLQRALSLFCGAKRTTRTVGVDGSSAIKTKPANTVKISNYLKTKKKSTETLSQLLDINFKRRQLRCSHR